MFENLNKINKILSNTKYIRNIICKGYEVFFLIHNNSTIPNNI